ncbi:MAG: ShlB/FhaC/HecB family hemolysin secretion/activation protein [Candidatus Magnetomorum sp.]|nr:ShlB/FhaC/HecB family hemolysin secretion/activation protein [Candidatus Magnetomorum sp.]
MSQLFNILRPVGLIDRIFYVIIIVVFTWNYSVAMDDPVKKPVTVRIQSFDIQGNTVISSETLQRKLKDYMAKYFSASELNLEDMQRLTDQMTLTYKEKGFFLARCYLPKQDIQNGVLKLVVSEGILDKIVVSGNTYYSERLLKGFFEHQQFNTVINEQDLEKGLILSNDLLNNHTELLLTKGDKQGSVNIVLNTSDRFASQFQADYNNYGAEHISKNRYSLSGKITDPYGGMTLFVKGTSGNNPQDSIVGYADLDIPINYQGTHISFSFIKSNSQLGQELDVLEMEGQTEMYGATLTHPFLLKRDTRINVLLDMQHTVSETTAWKSVSIGTYKLNSVKASISLDSVDHYFGKNQAQCSYQASFVDKGPGIEKTNKAFQKILLSASRMQQFTRQMHLSLRVAGQWSADDLIPIDQIAIGGYETVRGHPPSSYLGDMGYHLSIEWMVSPTSDRQYFGQPLSKSLQWGLFVDHGWIRLNSDPLYDVQSKSLGGYGLGLRLFYKERLSCLMDLAFPMNPLEDKDDMIMYFSVQSYF